jgi:hypothetical protein
METRKTQVTLFMLSATQSVFSILGYDKCFRYVELNVSQSMFTHLSIVFQVGGPGWGLIPSFQAGRGK